jgi:putative transposase
MKVIQKTFSYRLKPTNIQRALFAQYAGAARYIFNWGLNLVKEALNAQQPIPTYTDRANQLKELKRTEKTAWLKDIHSQVLQQSVKDLEKAISHFHAGKKSKRKIGFPRYKRKGVKDSFRFPQYVQCKDDKVFLPKIGWVGYINSRAIEGKIKQAVVKRECDHWYVHIFCEIELVVVKKPFSPQRTVGIDVGIKELAVLSNGQVYGNPHFLKSDLKKLKAAQKAHARKQKGSNNRRKSAMKIGKRHRKIKNKRKDYIHKISTEIVESQDTIVVETLNISGMMRNRNLAQAIGDVSWRMVLSQLKYKAEWRGKTYVEISRFTPTSKTCFSCKKEQAMPLSVRTYECKSCGYSMDRDLNAAMNIKAAGTAVLACGEMNISSLNEAGIVGL